MNDDSKKRNSAISDEENEAGLNSHRIPSQDTVFPDEREDEDDFTASETIVLPGMHEKKKEEEAEGEQNPKKKKRHHKKYPVRKMLRLSRVTAIVLIIADVLLVFDVVLMTRYATLSQSIFYKVNIGIMIVIAALNIFAMCALTHKKKTWLIIILVLSLALNCVGVYASYALSRINSSVDDMTSTSYTKSVSAALVIYSGSSDTVTDVEDLEGKTVGIAEGTDTAEIAKEYLSNKNITVEYKSYTGYTDVYKALINDEIACAVLPQTYSGLIDTDETLYSYYDQTSILASFSSDVQTSNEAGADKDLTTEPFTILISGENEGLADTIILASVNPISMKVTMISIPRDSYVPITCYNNSESKINAAHSVSESCLVETVEQLTGVTIDYTAEFTFASVIQIVDAVGGVDVVNETSFYGQSWDIENDELKVVPIPYDESGATVHLNGEQALGFVRERHAFADGDFAREQHQQEVIQQVIAKVMATRNPNTYLDILQAAGDNLKTNLDSQQVLTFLSYAMSKVDRYYNASNATGVFSFTTARLTGYSSSVYDSSLGLNLYIYRLYDGAIQDAYTATENNVNLDAEPDKFTGASWSGSRPYTAAAIIQDTYDEAEVYDDSSSDSYDYSSDDSTYYDYNEQYVPEQTYDYSQDQTVTEDNTVTYDNTDTGETVTDESASDGTGDTTYSDQTQTDTGTNTGSDTGVTDETYQQEAGTAEGQ